jgi:hypothetical protein
MPLGSKLRTVQPSAPHPVASIRELALLTTVKLDHFSVRKEGAGTIYARRPARTERNTRRKNRLAAGGGELVAKLLARVDRGIHLGELALRDDRERSTEIGARRYRQPGAVVVGAAGGAQARRARPPLVVPPLLGVVTPPALCLPPEVAVEPPADGVALCDPALAPAALVFSSGADVSVLPEHAVVMSHAPSAAPSVLIWPTEARYGPLASSMISAVCAAR